MVPEKIYSHEKDISLAEKMYMQRYNQLNHSFFSPKECVGMLAYTTFPLTPLTMMNYIYNE